MVHHERALAAELVPERERCADGAAGIARRRLHVDTPERRHPPHLTVGDRVHRTAASQRQIGQSRALLEDAEEMKECLLVHRLDRACDIAMAIL